MTSQQTIHQLELMQTIFGIISRRDLSIDQQLEEILKAGCSLFDEQIGIISRIEGDSYIIEHIYAPGFDIHKGQEFELEKTFCSIMVDSDRPLSIADVKKSDFRKHPCTSMGLESYIGMSISIDGEKFGTLNFSGNSPKEPPFHDSDLQFMVTLCDWIGNVIGYSKVLDCLNTRASHDSLTELYNRTAILESLERCRKKYNTNNDYVFAVLFVDLDRFKDVNDKLGHHVGDLLLNQVAQRLQRIMQRSDVIGRYGGDEFVAILENATQQQAINVSERIKGALSEAFTVKGHKIEISASVGIAINDDTECAEDLIDIADRSMYAEKNAKY